MYDYVLPSQRLTRIVKGLHSNADIFAGISIVKLWITETHFASTINCDDLNLFLLSL